MIIYYTDKYKGGREASHGLLREALTEYTGDSERAGQLVCAMKKGEHGKPYIDGFSCFSISHTGGIWAVLITDRECGLDIQLGRDCDAASIARRWFAPADAQRIEDLYEENEEAASAEFFRIWTKREALVKAMGSSVYETDLPPVSSGEAEADGRNYIMKNIAFPGGACSGEGKDLFAAVCMEGSGASDDITFCALQQQSKNERQ